MRSRTSRRPTGSSPDIGSSRKTTAGSFTSACETDALEHALGEFAKLLVPGLLVQTHARQEVGGAAPALGGTVAEQLGAVFQKLARRQVVVEVWVLGQVADIGVHSRVADLAAEDARAPGGRVDQAHEQLERRRLARAVGAEEAEDFAAPDAQREPVERAHPALAQEADLVVLRQFVDFDRRCHHFESSPATS
jgi:hypothetical protein